MTKSRSRQVPESMMAECLLTYYLLSISRNVTIAFKTE